MKKLIVLLVFCLTLLTACAKSTPAPTAIPTNAPTAIILPSSTPEPIPTATVASATPAPTVTPSVTPTPLKITYVGSTALLQGSSSFTLQFNQAVGSYYATGSITGQYVNYICEFDSIRTTNLNCTGGPMPGNTKVYVQLFDSITKTNVYSNMITFPVVVPTPAGVSCESEPKSGVPGCFSITCVLNGKFWYGNDLLCLGEWPFPWPFPHPLYDQLMNQK